MGIGGSELPEDPEELAEYIAKLQAGINSVQGKTVTVHLNDPPCRST